MFRRVGVANESQAAKRSVWKLALSWAVVTIALVLGASATSYVGNLGFPSADDPSTLVRAWITVVGFTLFAISFLVCPLIALRSPRHAGIGFLIVMPFTAFCVTYPYWYFRVSYADGKGSVEFLSPPAAIGLALTLFIPIAGGLLSFRNRKVGAIVFAIGGSLAVLVFSRSRWTSTFVLELGIGTGFFLAFGLFWLLTDHFHWPIPLPPHPRSVVRRVAGVVVMGFVILCVVVGIATAREAYFSSMWNPDCGLHPPVTRAHSASHAAFTARVVYVGLTVRSRLEIRNQPNAIRDPRVGVWAIGVVEERFGGVSPRWPHLVLLTNFIYWKDATYFIDGFPERSVWSAFPVVEGGIGCSRTRVIPDAPVDLHLLRQAPLKGAAIVGLVRQPGTYYSMVPPPDSPPVLVGAQVDVEGPAGTTTVTTDGSGVYQLDGLEAGEYTVRLHVPEGQVAGLTRGNGTRPDESVRKILLEKDELKETNFYLEWERKDGQGRQ
jgi:hypothetical protein